VINHPGIGAAAARYGGNYLAVASLREASASPGGVAPAHKKRPTKSRL
jgi:hypothetical protein